MRRKTAAAAILITGAALAIIVVAACQPQAPKKSPATSHVAAPTAKPEPTVPPAPPEFRGDFDARGTEPFWAARIRSDEITIMRPQTSPATAPNSGPRMAGPQAVWAAKVGEEPLVVALLEHECSDGATDRVYDYAVEVQIGEQSLSGCAERANR